MEEIGEHGTHFLTGEKPFIDALEMAKHNQHHELAGMVINAFTQPMESPWDLLNIIKAHKDDKL